MEQAEHFSCERCGQPFRWEARLAGKKLQCRCGQIMVVPEEPSAGVYELREDGEIAPVRVVKATSPLEYQGKEPARAELDYDPLIGSKLRDFWIPIVLIALATALYFGQAIHLMQDWKTGMFAASVQMVMNMAVVLVTVLLTWRWMDMRLGEPAGVALRLAAIALLPNAVCGTIMLSLGLCGGILLAAIVSMLLYGTMFTVFFEIGLPEAIFCVLMVWALGAASWFLVNDLLLAWLGVS